MTLDLLLQIIKEQVETFKDNYGYDYWWILNSLEESILKEYERRKPEPDKIDNWKVGKTSVNEGRESSPDDNMGVFDG